MEIAPEIWETMETSATFLAGIVGIVEGLVRKLLLKELVRWNLKCTLEPQHFPAERLVGVPPSSSRW